MHYLTFHVPRGPPVIIHAFLLESLFKRVRVPNVGGVRERQNGNLFHGHPQQVGSPGSRIIIEPLNEVPILDRQCQRVQHAVHEH